MRRIGVLASGSGTIFQALSEAGLPLVVMVTDRPCGAIERAEEVGLAVELVARDSFGANFDRWAYTERVVAALEHHQVDLVVMAGFMTILDQPVHDVFGGRITNTHPSLLPAFKGAHAITDALAAGVTTTGCTVHLATLAVDDGPILAQESVPVLPSDTEESLHERIKEVERRLYPEVLLSLIKESALND